jgi:hypothetical protein
MRLDRAIAAALSLGRTLFSLAITALGIETLVCARYVGHSLGPQYNVIPALPLLPAIPWIACGFGIVWVACGATLLSRRPDCSDHSRYPPGELLFRPAPLAALPCDSLRN